MAEGLDDLITPVKMVLGDKKKVAAGQSKDITA